MNSRFLRGLNLPGNFNPWRTEARVQRLQHAVGVDGTTPLMLSHVSALPLPSRIRKERPP
jgi:hypothetical protein